MGVYLGTNAVDMLGGQRSGSGGGETPTLQTKNKTYTPTTSQQTETITADSGYDGLDEVNVTVDAMPSGTAGTPTATKGTVSNHQVNVTPSVTNTTGYITGSTKTGTAVTVSASELVSGTKQITENGTGIDVTNYEKVDVAVPTGGSDGKNIQVYSGTAETNSTSYTATAVKLTVKKSGTYKVSWIGWRSNGSGSWGTQVYVNGTAKGSQHTTFTRSYGQYCTETLTLNANDEIVVRAKSRGSSYYMVVGNLIIEEQ